MRTSRVSQETSRLLSVSTRSSRSSHTRLASDPFSSIDAPSSSSDTVADLEDLVPSSRKRKRELPARTPVKKSPRKTVTIKTEVQDTVSFSPSKDRKVRKPARQIKNNETGEVEIHPPNDWEEVYASVMTMRTTGSAQHAAVDTMGCDKLGEDSVGPKVKRYHTLTALMLSSQTKDTTNAIAMKRLQTQLPAYKEGAPIGLNLENILVCVSLLTQLKMQIHGLTKIDRT